MEFTVSKITDYRLLCDVFNRAMRDQGFSPLEGEEADALVLVPVMMRAAQLLEDAGGDPDLPRMRGDYSGVDPKALKLAEHCIYKAAEDAISNLEEKFSLGTIAKSRELATIQNIRIPDVMLYPKDRVTNMFFSGELEPEKPVNIESGKDKKSGRRVAPHVTVSLLDLPPHVEISQEPTQFDNAVFRAVCSLFKNGTTSFTGGTIWRTMKGDPDADPTQETLAAINESWTRLTSIAMEIDTKNVGDAYGFVRWVRNRRVIEGGSDVFTFKNQHGVTEAAIYTINEEPTLLTYAEQLKQVERYPIAVLDTPINKTPEIIILQNKLISRIEAMPNLNNHIVYDNLFSSIGVTAATPGALRKKKATLRKQIRTMFDYWVSIGFIKSWTEEKNGRSISSIIVNKGRRKELKAPTKSGNDTHEKR